MTRPDGAFLEANLPELPPLPVVRAQLLGVLQAPASKLVRTIAEPARSLAAVFRAYSEKEEAPAAAAASRNARKEVTAST